MNAEQTSAPTEPSIRLVVAGRTINLIQIRGEFHATRRELQALLPEGVLEAGGPPSTLVPLRRAIASMERTRDELDTPGALAWATPVHQQRWYALHAAIRCLEELCVAACSMGLAAEYLDKCTGGRLGAHPDQARTAAGSFADDVRAGVSRSERQFSLEVGMTPKEWLAAQSNGLSLPPPAGVSRDDVTATAQTIAKVKALVGQDPDQAGTAAALCGRVHLLAPFSEQSPCVLPAGHKAASGAAENLCRNAAGGSWLYGAGELPASPRYPSVVRSHRLKVPRVD